MCEPGPSNLAFEWGPGPNALSLIWRTDLLSRRTSHSVSESNVQAITEKYNPRFKTDLCQDILVIVRVSSIINLEPDIFFPTQARRTRDHESRFLVCIWFLPIMSGEHFSLGPRITSHEFLIRFWRDVSSSNDTKWNFRPTYTRLGPYLLKILSLWAHKQCFGVWKLPGEHFGPAYIFRIQNRWSRDMKSH